MIERWLPVVGHEGYEVSDQGRVRSLDRVVQRGVRPMRRRGAMLTTWVGKRGYPLVSLGRGNVRYVHHLVLEAFVGLRGVGEECRHGPGGARDSRLENLCWGTSRENKLDQVRDGTHPQASKRTCRRQHELVEPYLLSHLLRRGARSCLACHRARNWARGRELTDEEFTTAADRFYADLVGVMPLS